MNTRSIIVGAGLALGIAAASIPAAQAAEDGTIVVCKESLAQPVAAGACAAAFVLLHEALAERPFGPNGEIMKVLSVPVKIVDGNIKGSERESGEVAKVIRATTGISILDIGKYCIWGGPNSFFRKPFG